MGKILVNESSLSGIATAIRQKNGESTTYKPGEMAQAILDIPTGGSAVIESKSITENGTYTAPSGVDGYSPVTVAVQPNLQSKNITPGASQQTIQPDNGYDGLSSVVVAGDVDLVAGNIKKNVEIFGVTGSYEGSGGGGNTNILSGANEPTTAQGNNGNIYLQYIDIPNEYTLLSYLQATGTQYVDTGISVSDLTSMEVKFANPVAPQWSGICGASQGNTDKSNCIAINTSNGYTGVQYGNTYANIYNPITDSAWHIVQIDGGKCIFDGTQIGQATYSGSFNVPVNAYLFAVSQSSGTLFASNFSGKIAQAKLWEDGVLSGYLVPVKRNSDSELGMYDLVNQSFKINIGSGTFTAGPEVTNGTITDTYLKVSGMWQNLIGSDIDDIGGI